VESTPPLVCRIPINPDGSAGGRAVVVELPRTVPDGVAFDVDGNLYISLYTPKSLSEKSYSVQLQVLNKQWKPNRSEEKCRRKSVAIPVT
jgi:sugar lactone lactonase YvrE